jgi:hypothetical protein
MAYASYEHNEMAYASCDIVIGVINSILDAIAPKLGVPMRIFAHGADSLLLV